MMKKRVASFVLLMSSILNGGNCFEFVNNKSDGWGLDPVFIQKLVNTFDLDVFFETGTYQGVTTLEAASYFREVFTVEFQRDLFEQIKHIPVRHPHVHVYYGSSPELIRSVVGSIEGRILFWLDAHYSGGGTALSAEDPNTPEALTPIRAELNAIAESGIRDCVILIDDIRIFGTEINGHTFFGCWAYPTVQEIKTMLLKINPHFEVALLGDILLAYDQSMYQPEFSETVNACTKMRFYDGYNLTNEEIQKCERVIEQAPLREREFMKRLCIWMEEDNQVFLMDRWEGLSRLGQGDFENAIIAFQRAERRIQSSLQKEGSRF